MNGQHEHGKLKHSEERPVMFRELAEGTLFRIHTERKEVYHRCVKSSGMARSRDHRVYKKWGNSHSSTKDGAVAILALKDMVMPYAPRGGQHGGGP